jgi:hypothetical protein
VVDQTPAEYPLQRKESKIVPFPIAVKERTHDEAQAGNGKPVTVVRAKSLKSEPTTGKRTVSPPSSPLGTTRPGDAEQ